MKSLLLASAVVFGLSMSGSAFAADMPLKAPPPYVPYSWTGFYVGLNGGYSWGNSETTYAITGLPPVSISQSMDGWVFGGQAGYNLQFNRSWLIGVEADLQATGQNGTTPLSGALATVLGTTTVPLVITTTGSLAQKLPWFGTARLRLGFLPTDRWMVYVTGGLAYGDIETTGNAAVTAVINGAQLIGSGSAAVSSSVTNVGWTVGAGSEFVISGPWTAKLEYLYVDLGTVSNTFTGAFTTTVNGAVFPTIAISSHVTDNIFRGGVNYRF